MFDLWSIKGWIYGKRWRHKPHVVECVICGKLLQSKKDYYSPEECGWMKIVDSAWGTRKYWWMCHKCFYHRDFKPFVKEADRREEEKYHKLGVDNN